MNKMGCARGSQYRSEEIRERYCEQARNHTAENKAIALPHGRQIRAALPMPKPDHVL